MNEFMTKKDALIILSSAFPNLDWVAYTTDKCYGNYRALFLDGWGFLTVDVLQHGCMATLVVGNSVIVRSPNEQGKTLQEVLAVVCNEWDKIALVMSAEKRGDR